MVTTVIIFGAKGTGICGGECSEIEEVIIRKQQQGCAGRRGEIERVEEGKPLKVQRKCVIRGISSRRINITLKRP